MNQHAHIDRERIGEFCQRWSIAELALFGSILRDDFRPDSDIDVLLSFAEGSAHSLFDLARMQAELGQILGRDVHVLSRRAVEASRNPIRRDSILNSAETVYAA